MLRIIAILITFMLININNVVLTQELPLTHKVVDKDGPKNPWAKIICDIDGDGVNDIVIGGQNGPLVWYKSPDWTRHHIVKGGYETVDGEAADIDGDGNLDIVMGGLFWYENPGKEEVKEWPTHKIANHPTHDIEVGDLDNDGDVDVITRDQSEFGSKAGNRVYLWFQGNDGKWQDKVLTCPHGEGIDKADLDGDGDIDVIINGIWFENPGKNHIKREWPAHQFSDWHPSSTVATADFNKDGRLDVVLSPSELKKQQYKLSWFEAPQDPQKGKWKEHVLIEKIECVIHGLQTADMNNDGRMDVIYSEMHQGVDPDEVVVLINPKKGTKWTKQVVSKRGSHYIQAGDLDGDGDIDLMGANWSGGYQPVEIWVNGLK